METGVIGSPPRFDRGKSWFESRVSSKEFEHDVFA